MKLFFGIALTIISLLSVHGQTEEFIVSNNIYLPKDSITKTRILNSLNGFLFQVEKPNNENSFVLKSELLETSILLDEMKSLKKSSKFKDDSFYKCYLTNLTKITDSTFLVQLAYTGRRANTSILRADITLYAKKIDTSFHFHSPLLIQTSNWKSKKMGQIIFHFKRSLNTGKAKKYFSKVDEFDKKLNAQKIRTEFYCADNSYEALQMIGINYKSDYNAQRNNILSAKESNMCLIVNGLYTSDFTSFDPHDLWHSRLHNILSTKIINRPVDEGTAYLYGGSWGLSWEAILQKFKKYADTNPNSDWLQLYNESKNFDPEAKYPLNVDFVINALLVQKIEKEKGFQTIIELLSCGKKEKDNENYFKALEKITGITKTDFNSAIWKLIK